MQFAARLADVQTPWIELGLIPIIPVLACYLFTKLADYVLDRITAYRHHETASRLRTPHRGLLAGTEEPEDQPAQHAKIPMTTPVTRLGNSALPRGTAEINRMAGGNAENPVSISNNHAFSQCEAATLTRGTRSRVFERGGIRGGVGRSAQGGVRRRDSVGERPVARIEAQGSGWWFDARWY